MTTEFFHQPNQTRAAMAGDPHRPVYHFLPPQNWMNDPNGLFYWQAKYHLFYQFNPFGSLWGSIHWGHASSTDLVHWQDHPIALAPEPGTGDENGCWSGCLVDDNGIPTAIYTGYINRENTPVMLARSTNTDLVHWEKSPYNPIISQIPAGVNPSNFRDPYVWQEDGVWKLVLGAGLDDGSGAVLLYQSDDLVQWHYQGILFQKKTLETITMWECPNFFRLGDHYVLIVSLFPDVQGVYYYVGDYDGDNFTPLTEGFLDRGPVFYAPQVRSFPGNRTILFSWLMEQRSDDAVEAAGWSGVQAIPRDLALDDNLKLVSRPIQEIQQLRGKVHQANNLQTLPDNLIQLPVAGRHLEIELVLQADSGVFILEVNASPNGKETTRISYDFANQMVMLDTRNSSLAESAAGTLQQLDLPTTKEDLVKTRVFLDGSVIEVWFNDQQALTARSYPSMADSHHLYLNADGGSCKVKDLQVWQMKPIWPVN